MSEDQPDYITDAEEMMGWNEPRRIVQEVSGFIPVFEVVMKFYNDHLTALVFGRIWQYCGMEDGVCRASLARIGKDLEISAATVMRHADKLVNDKFLIDTTPDRRNRPHIYADAGRVVMKSQIQAVMKEPGVSQRNTDISQSKSAISERNTSVSESQLIKQDKTTNKTNDKKRGAEKPPPPPEVNLYRSVTKRFPHTAAWHIVVKRMQAVSKRLGRPVEFDDLKDFYGHWCGRRYNPENIDWLEWAMSGIIPQNGNGHKTTEAPRGVEAAQKFLERHGNNGNSG